MSSQNELSYGSNVPHGQHGPNRQVDNNQRAYIATTSSTNCQHTSYNSSSNSNNKNGDGWHSLVTQCKIIIKLKLRSMLITSSNDLQPISVIISKTRPGTTVSILLYIGTALNTG